MDPVLKALADQKVETGLLVSRLTKDESDLATRCIGWSVTDVLLHLAQSDEMAIASLTGQFGDAPVDSTKGWGGGTSVDDSVSRMVERERGTSYKNVLERWTLTTTRLAAVLDAIDLSTRVLWVAGDLSARTLATARLSETWIHTGDIADAVGVELVPTDRLKLIARLAWRTLPFAFKASGLAMSGAVAFRLVGPSGEQWEFVPDGPVITTISGLATELCEVAARRLDPAATGLVGAGPDAVAILALVRTYA